LFAFSEADRRAKEGPPLANGKFGAMKQDGTFPTFDSIAAGLVAGVQDRQSNGGFGTHDSHCVDQIDWLHVFSASRRREVTGVR
jgi:hypothetical protein